MMTQRKLLILSYDFPPSNGGIARLCNEIAQGISAYYDSIEVVTRDVRGPSLPYNSKSIIITRFGESRGKLEFSILNYLKKFDKNNTDILCGVWHPEGIIAKIAGFKNIFILGHGTEFLHGNIFWRKYFWLNIYCKFILESTSCLITNSHYTKRLAEKISKKARVNAVPLGVNSNFFKPTVLETSNFDDKINIVSLSRILKFKGYDFIAKTIASLSEEYKHKIVWNIGGTGPYLQDLKLLVKELKIDDITYFHGFIPDDKLPDFYSKNDLFILCTREADDTSDVEGFGLVFIEAQSCGVPVIGTNTGGIPDAIDHQNGGWLIPQDDEDKLSNLLKIIIKDKSIVINEGIKARNRILKTSTLDKYCQKINAIINE
ncbi:MULTISPECIES: glycosyltransferase family 4 protein [unclassified Empedobacter]|uniref:glycosyltransferase family 4 protein n=1 Tax=unclassified Empedobacter TaxID=2643773 RepID=UPI0025C09B1D|nr:MULTISPECIES: glycosyltransferase family 4 protein [unclassified Empedobacter]